jgi:DNA-binding transcriptional ArsR family regulator
MITKTQAPYLAPEWVEASEKIKALAHPIRLYIIALLKTQKEMNVTDFQNELQLEQAVVSHHLNLLKDRNILDCRRDGRNMYYSLKSKKVLSVLSCIETALD